MKIKLLSSLVTIQVLFMSNIYAGQYDLLKNKMLSHKFTSKFSKYLKHRLNPLTHPIGSYSQKSDQVFTELSQASSNQDNQDWDKDIIKALRKGFVSFDVRAKKQCIPMVLNLFKQLEVKYSRILLINDLLNNHSFYATMANLPGYSRENLKELKRVVGKFNQHIRPIVKEMEELANKSSDDGIHTKSLNKLMLKLSEFENNQQDLVTDLNFHMATFMPIANANQNVLLGQLYNTKKNQTLKDSIKKFIANENNIQDYQGGKYNVFNKKFTIVPFNKPNTKYNYLVEPNGRITVEKLDSNGTNNETVSMQMSSKDLKKLKKSDLIDSAGFKYKIGIDKLFMNRGGSLMPGGKLNEIQGELEKPRCRQQGDDSFELSKSKSSLKSSVDRFFESTSDVSSVGSDDNMENSIACSINSGSLSTVLKAQQNMNEIISHEEPVMAMNIHEAYRAFNAFRNSYSADTGDQKVDDFNNKQWQQYVVKNKKRFMGLFKELSSKDLENNQVLRLYEMKSQLLRPSIDFSNEEYYVNNHDRLKSFFQNMEEEFQSTLDNDSNRNFNNAMSSLTYYFKLHQDYVVNNRPYKGRTKSY